MGRRRSQLSADDFYLPTDSKLKGQKMLSYCVFAL